MLHELTYHDESNFTTLTYDDEHLPPNASLVKRDLQLYFKRVRKMLPPSKRIRYFACGEYGDLTHRPHYHAIIFGLGLKQPDQELLTNCWGKGMVKIGLAEPDSINYVAQYIDKKFSGDLAEQEYKLKGREAVFRISSQGLGRSFCDEHHQQIIDNGYLTVKGIKTSIPRYYLKRLGNVRTSLTGKTIIDPLKIENDFADDNRCKVVEKYTGIYINSEDLYNNGDVVLNDQYIDGVKRARKQSERNLIARCNLKTKKL